MAKAYLKFTPGCCWRRLLDLKIVENWLKSNGKEIVDHPILADYIFLMTCAFVQSTEDHAIREVRGYLKYTGQLTVLGCLPGINAKRLGQNFTGLVVNTVDLGELGYYFPEFQHKLDINRDAHLLQDTVKRDSLPIIKSCLFCLRNTWRIYRAGMGLKRNLYYIRIGGGCSNECTFCVERKAVGYVEKNKPVGKILEEVWNGFQAGYRNFAVIADNTAAWKDRGYTFIDLLNAILDLHSSIRIANIDSMHPKYIKDSLASYYALFAQHRIKSVMIALQSGSDYVLGKMNRGYRKKDIIKVVDMLKKAYPKIVLITQLIAGFPGESSADFEESVDLVKQLGFINVMIFPYSRNSGTKAGSLPCQIGKMEIQRRVDWGLAELRKSGIFSFNLGAE